MIQNNQIICYNKLKEKKMGLVKAKCLNCGANLNVDKYSRAGTCTHCGASFITEDVIINNITNINYNETINGVKLKRQAVLENLLIKYYTSSFDDVDNIKEYALKVQEYDLNNSLANFVVFNELDSASAIKNFLGSNNINISLDLFIYLMNACDDNIIQNKIINNIVKYKSQMDIKVLLKKIIYKYKNKDDNFMLNLIYNFKLDEHENDKLLEELYNNTKTDKLIFLLRLKLFKSKHADFTYNTEKFKNYELYWKALKEKYKSKKLDLITNENTQQTTKDTPIKTKYKTKKIAPILWISISVVLLFLIILCINIF